MQRLDHLAGVIAATKAALVGGGLAILGGALPPAALGQEFPALSKGVAADSVYQVDETGFINHFDGNLTLPIDLGPGYPVSADLALQVAVVYNSHAWHVIDETHAGYPTCTTSQSGACGGVSTEPVDLPVPGPDANAGLGWLVSFGRLFKPGEAPFDSTETWRWNYVGADGASHGFRSVLHEGDTPVTGVSYTGDGSMMRMREASGGACANLPAGVTACRLVELAGGTVKEFAAFGSYPDYRITQWRDRHGGTISFAYAGSTLTITDSQGRSQIVRFADASLTKVESVDLTAFDQSGNPAVYDLVYETRDVERPRYVFLSNHCADTPVYQGVEYPDDEPVAVELLTRIVRPDGSYHELHYDDKGLLDGVRFPTGLYAALHYRPFLGGNAGGSRCYNQGKFSAYGVDEKRLYSQAPPAGGEPDPAALLSTWLYTKLASAALSTSGPGPTSRYKCHHETWVHKPDGHYEIEYFNTRAGGGDAEYGLPYSRLNLDSGICDGVPHPPYLSREVYRCDSPPCDRDNPGTRLRSVWVEYEHEYVGASGLRDHRRVEERTVFHRPDTGGTEYEVETTSSDYDGVGHYRAQATTSTVPYSTASSATTDYNPGTTAAYTPGTTDPWILDTFDATTVVDGGHSATARHCFDPATGFLTGQRTVRGGSGGAVDLLTLFTPDPGTGFVATEAHYGGDARSLGAFDSGDPCALGAGAETEAEYTIARGYDAGALATETWLDSTGAAVLQPADATIDSQTGAVAADRRPDGLEIAYDYDLRGRLIAVTPSAGGWVKYEYQSPTVSDPTAAVELRQLACGEGVPFGSCTEATALTRVRNTYEARGLVESRVRNLPDTAGSGEVDVTQSFEYDAEERLTRHSEWGSTVFATTYGSFDPFGRPRTVTRPDGSVVTTTWEDDGGWKQTTEVAVETLSGEETSTVTGWYDSAGRLARLDESLTPTTSATTTYRFDEGDRIALVCVDDDDGDPANPCGGQPRSFDYDGAGLLFQESHPEIGGTVSYGHDALGNVIARLDPLYALAFDYDGAARPTHTWDDAGNLLAETYYGRTAGPDRGKVTRRKRQNVIRTPERPDADQVVTISEELEYGGVAHRLSKITTTSSTGFYFESRIDGYDDLGNVTLLRYPECAAPRCAGAGAAPSVASSYTAGRLTAVAGYAPAVGYHPDGTLALIAHANGIDDVRSRDAVTWSPLHAITAGSLWDSGPYDYDGAGNVIAVGNETYRYDHLGRLVQGTVDPDGTGVGMKTQSLAFDRRGNLTAMTTDGSPRDFLVDAATNRMGTASYDSLGRVTSLATGIGLEHDALERVARVSGGGLDRYFAYTAAGERVATFDLVAGTETWTLRGSAGRLLSRFTAAGGSWTRDEDYVHAGTTQIARRTAAGDRHLHVDHLGSTRVVSDDVGGLVERLTYYPFGETTQDPGTGAGALQFTGHERDDNGPGLGADLDYLHARFLSPWAGRFLSPDPVPGAAGAPQSWNRYAYARNNPLGFVDPDGELEIRAYETPKTRAPTEIEDHLSRGDRPTEFRYSVSFDSTMLDRTTGLTSKLSKAFKKLMKHKDRVEKGVDLLVGEDIATEEIDQSELDQDFEVSDFEKRVKRLFDSRATPQGFTYSEADLDTLQRSIDLVLRNMQQDGLSDRDHRILKRIYDVEELRRQAVESARQSLKERVR